MEVMYTIYVVMHRLQRSIPTTCPCLNCHAMVSYFRNHDYISMFKESRDYGWPIKRHDVTIDRPCHSQPILYTRYPGCILITAQALLIYYREETLMHLANWLDDVYPRVVATVILSCCDKLMSWLTRTEVKLIAFTRWITFNSYIRSLHARNSRSVSQLPRGLAKFHLYFL